MYFIKSLTSVLFSNGLVVMMGTHSCCGVQFRRFFGLLGKVSWVRVRSDSGRFILLFFGKQGSVS